MNDNPSISSPSRARFMNSSSPPDRTIIIRSLQLRDYEAVQELAAKSWTQERASEIEALQDKLEQFQQWYGLLKLARLLPNSNPHPFHLYVAEQQEKICGLICVSPFNRTRSTWQVQTVLIDFQAAQPQEALNLKDIGSQLLRHCFETIWEARTWLLEVNVSDRDTLALYRQNGFQPLAQMTYWDITSEIVLELAQHKPSLPNLLPVSNAEAQLLYQLDTVSMPPLLRQVFDRHIQDFKTPLLRSTAAKFERLVKQTEVASAYVFEPQRKAAIGYFKLESFQEDKAHKLKITVHPAYTWLYPELFAQMAGLIKEKKVRSLEVVSADYQPEREEYLEKLGAERQEHTLLMSRSVWHKLRETRREGLQLSDMLQGLKPARTPVPSRIHWLKSFRVKPSESHSQENNKHNPPEATS
ncbi:GNAT family N-acetyltransferase [Spirulina sp. 06S082]|uniref:GNAT family N-acetyltransferase n=1 Tax=Spirulina sp. 06S082 TaxID=3110248 RepID=UPI002B1FA501|nr:GNAT family N-acetyltransferase [Spirulina sp. 06S082]MEA5471841.1 GNAT family N-acetyltransferase [Spirulina sp. 06S082]